ncbi:hypothetical protein VTK73DRAFT_4984 [Phialemonium thermophilum]|uniref:Uncharacterized protein n=1 Tax=Phialemonium thermophilum TaxID=223376 RepID=A0ABR3XYI7_9PEZI
MIAGRQRSRSCSKLFPTDAEISSLSKRGGDRDHVRVGPIVGRNLCRAKRTFSHLASFAYVLLITVASHLCFKVEEGKGVDRVCGDTKDMCGRCRSLPCHGYGVFSILQQLVSWAPLHVRNSLSVSRPGCRTRPKWRLSPRPIISCRARVSQRPICSRIWVVPQGLALSRISVADWNFLSCATSDYQKEGVVGYTVENEGKKGNS